MFPLPASSTSPSPSSLPAYQISLQPVAVAGGLLQCGHLASASRCIAFAFGVLATCGVASIAQSGLLATS